MKPSNEEIFKSYCESGFSYTKAAKAHGVARSTFTEWISNIPTDVKEYVLESLAKENKEGKEQSASYSTVVNKSPERMEFPLKRSLFIGDRHQKPGQETLTLKKINKLISDRKYDRVVIMGDWWDMHSLSYYDKNDSAGGKSKPTYQEDLKSGQDALECMLDGLPSSMEVLFEEGNHEHRIFRYENDNPEVEGFLSNIYLSGILSLGIKYTEFKSLLMLDGIGIVHVPYGAFGKEIKGKYPEMVIGREASCDLIFAHTHRYSFYSTPKLGPRTSINVLNVGCSLPDGHVEEYAKHSMTGWKYGVCEVVTKNSEIIGNSFISMAELSQMY